MSFILDALKKSEAERQRNHGPALAEVPYGPRRGSQPWWLIGLGSALLIGIVVLIVVLLRMQKNFHSADAVSSPAPLTSPQATLPTESAVAAVRPPNVNAQPRAEGTISGAAASAAATTPQRGASSAVSTALTNPTAPAPESAQLSGANRSLAEEAATVDTESGAPGADLAAASAVPQREPIVRSITPAITPGRVIQPEGRYRNENLPTVNELSGKVAAAIPTMHLDIHVYAVNPAERFVFINMHKYVEGDSTSDGLQVERITSDGVVLNQHGLRFLLPRQ